MTGRPVSIEDLRALSPIDSLKPENLKALAKKATVQEMPGGRFLFREGDCLKQTVYLLNGEVELHQGESMSQLVVGGQKEARHPLSPAIPRKYSARARSRIEYIAIDTDLLDVMLTWDQTGSYEVSEIHGTRQEEVQQDWMTTLLQTKAFHKIPPANIQAIFMRMQQVKYNAGDLVIKQGDEGDFFYVITEGACEVTRETPLNKNGIKLADLAIGDTFGEEALIADSKRNATVAMKSDGVLMRLAKEDFNKLLNEPMLQWVSADEATQILNDGGQWLDVRLPSEYDNFHKDGAINMPLYFLRLKMKTLDKEKKYIVCCDTGRRSSAAAFILGERGFDAYVLKGGLSLTDE